MLFALRSMGYMRNRTYEDAITKIAINPSFCFLGICNAVIIGIGIIASIKSVKIWNAANEI